MTVDLADVNAVYYVTGALIQSELRLRKCSSCSQLLSHGKALEPLSEQNFDLISNDVKHFMLILNRGGLLMPTDLAFNLSMKCFGMISIILKNQDLKKIFWIQNVRRSYF